MSSLSFASRSLWFKMSCFSFASRSLLIKMRLNSRSSILFRAVGCSISILDRSCVAFSILKKSELEAKEKLATLQNPPVTEHQENIIPPFQDLKQLSKYSNKQPVCVCKEIDHTYTGLKEVYELEISKIKTERDDLLKTCNFEKDELSHQVVLDNGQINQLLVKLKEGEEKQMALSKELAEANEEVANLENSGRELKMELENKEKEYSKKWQEDEKFIVTPYKVREEELLQMIQALEKQVREDQHEKQKNILESTQMIQALEKKVQEYERGKQNMMESQYEFL